MSNERILSSRASNNVTLTETLTNCTNCFSDAVGLFYSAVKCQFGKVSGAVVSDENSTSLDLAGVFEARIFNNVAELRWLNLSGGKGRAVLLSQADIKNYLTADAESIQAIEMIDSQYLLWGEANENRKIGAGWSWLSSARIGKLAVPIADLNSKERVKLRFREYLGECDDYGNVAVVEERLIGLSKY